MRGSKIPVQELWLKMGGGVFARGGGVIAGFYGMWYCTVCLGKCHDTALWYKYKPVYTPQAGQSGV